MGIGGFKGFFSKNTEISKPFELYDRKVIFDGRSLIHFLYGKTDRSYGEDFKEYTDIIRSFMFIVQQCKIRPIVVIDGGHENENRKFKFMDEGVLKEICNSHETDSVTLFPLLILEVFHSVLSELKIPFLITDYNESNQVVVQANHHECPIISNDKEFYMLDARWGFILLESIDRRVNTGKKPDGVEFKFLKCKMYKIDEFIEFFPGLDKYHLSLFGDLMEVPFFNYDIFKNFYEELPVYENEEFYLENENYKNMANLLRWIQHKTLNEAKDEIISYLDNLDMYMHINPKYLIESFFNIYKIYDDRKIDFHNDSQLTRMIKTRCGQKLPIEFIKKYRHDYSRFFINVILKHMVYLTPQIEKLELPSGTHKCSSYIRQIMYGTLVRHDINGTECRSKWCLGDISEYDIHGYRITKTRVPPISSIEGIVSLPKMNDVHIIGKERCIEIIAKVLGIHSDYLCDVPDSWKLYIACINYWLRESGTESQSLISAVTLNLIYFGLIEAKNPFSEKELCPNTNFECLTCSCSNICCTGAKIESEDMRRAGIKLKTYCTAHPSTEMSNWILNFEHAVSQLKSCLLHIIYLNRLLNDHLKSPNPRNYFSSKMLFNLIDDICAKPDPGGFIEQILGKPLKQLFSRLKSKICENAVDDTYRNSNVKY